MNNSRPNVIIITTDQQRTDSLSCYGSAFTNTPNLDRLANEGVIFDRAYCANPVCTPARASIFGGRYLSRHGAWNVGMNVPDDERFISHILAGAGYRTHYVGKAHFQSFGAKPDESTETLKDWWNRYPEWTGPYYGFETVELALGHVVYGIAGHYGTWVRSMVDDETFKSFSSAKCLSDCRFGGQAYDWHLPVGLHNSVWTADRTIDFLKKHGNSGPFMLGVGFQDPHHAHCVSEDFHDRVAPEDVPLPDFDEGELDDKPPHFMAAREGRLKELPTRGEFEMAGQMEDTEFTKVKESDARLGRSHYYTMVKLIDREIGRILDYLEKSGLAENTIIVFTTDHGELLGDHGLWMKGPFHYEQLIRIPMIMRWPRNITSGHRTDAIFSQVDIAPTILESCGVEPPENIDGVSGLRMLRDGTGNIRDAALVECVDDPKGLRLKTIVTRNRKLTWYCGQQYGELYDLENDPREKQNLWRCPEYGGDKSALLARLLEEYEPIEKRVKRDCYA